MVNVKEDLTGKVFERLTVIEQGEDYVNPNGVHLARWRCICNCGNPNVLLIRGTSLANGNTKSCGCLSKETAAIQGKKNKKYNTYDIETQNFGVGYTLKNDTFLFDLEDYDLIKDYCWSVAFNGYLAARDNNGNITYMHRLIMGNPDEKIIDHINHNICDNRKCNLRIVTQSENNANAKLHKNNTSGVKGVGFRKDTLKWYGRISYKKKVYRKSFNTKQEAIEWRKAKERELFGEYTYNESLTIQN